MLVAYTSAMNRNMVLIGFKVKFSIKYKIVNCKKRRRFLLIKKLLTRLVA